MAKTHTLATAAVVLAAIITIAGCSPQRDIYTTTFSELPEGAKYEFGPGYSRYVEPGLSVEVNYLTPTGVDIYFSRFRGGVYKNPFPPLAYMVFSMTVENTGDKPVSINPGMIMFVTGKKEPFVPKDYPGMYTDLSLAKAEDEEIEERMEAYRASSYDTTEVLDPGDSVHKLLVLKRTKEEVKEGVFVFSGLYIGKENRSLTIQYEGDLSLPAEMFVPAK